LQGSRNAALLGLFSVILLFIQAVISSALLDDWLGAFVAGSFGFVMLIFVGMAYFGGLSAVVETTTTESPDYGTGYVTRTITSRDTGQRIQMTPCCGICGGIGIIVVVFMFAGDLLFELLPAIAPGIIAGILAILAGIVFAIEYKGPWTGQAF